MSRHARVYRTFLRLYPSDFRREYGWLMVQGFDDRLRTRRMERVRLPAFRTWVATARDLTLTVPAERKDHVMNRLSPEARFVTLVAAFVVGVAIILILGSAFSAIPFLLVLLALPFFAVRYLRNHRMKLMWRWWRVLASGVVLLGATALAFGGPWPESFRSNFPDDVMWSVGFFLVIGSFALIGIGIALGIIAWFDRRSSMAV